MTLLGFELVAVSEISDSFAAPLERGRMFSVRELSACASQKKPNVHLAARLAAKRECVSALAGIARLNPSDVRVTTLSGKPRILCADPRLARWKIRISLSHSDRHAAAFCAASFHDRLSGKKIRHP